MTKTIYVEKLSDAGMRLVAYSDEVCDLRHKGWFTHEEIQDETYRGAVVQLPGRNGQAVLLAAYQESCNDGFVVDIGDVTLADATDDNLVLNGETHDVARTADSMAENAAEQERDYHRAWDLGSDWARYQEQADEAHSHARRLLADLRKARKIQAPDLPTLCQVVRDTVRAEVREIAKARRDRDRIIEENTFRGDHIGAFNDGAGTEVISS